MSLRRVVHRVTLAVVLALVVVLLPDAGPQHKEAALVRMEHSSGVDSDKDILWVLMVGSDARTWWGEDITKTRGDALQLVGLNLETGEGVIIGTPRDSWVRIDGVGYQRVNAALYFGGPELMGKTIADLYEIDLDYVFVAGFMGLASLVRSIGGITVDSDMAFHDDNLPGEFVEGENFVNGLDAVRFGRMRHYLPRGDFDRSAHQGEVIRAIAAKVDENRSTAGFIEKGLLSVLKNLHTDLSPGELWKLAQAAATIDPAKLKDCVLQGSLAMKGGASVVDPSESMRAKLVEAIKDDATLEGDCEDYYPW